MPFSKKHFFLPLNAGESVFLVIRKHWVVPAVKLILLIIIFAIFMVAEYLTRSSLPQNLNSQILLAIALARTVLVILLLLGMLSAWTMYYLNVQIITSERVIDINQRGLLQHETSELNLDKVEDVTAEIKGILPNLFDYGNVYVQTAGEMRNFAFEFVSHPHQIARIVLSLYEKMQAEKLLAMKTQDAAHAEKTKSPMKPVERD